MDGQLPKPKANVAQSTQSFSSPEKHAPKPTSSATSENDKVALDFAKKQKWQIQKDKNTKKDWNWYEVTYQEALDIATEDRFAYAVCRVNLQGNTFEFRMYGPEASFLSQMQGYEKIGTENGVSISVKHNNAPKANQPKGINPEYGQPKPQVPKSPPDFTKQQQKKGSAPDYWSPHEPSQNTNATPPPKAKTNDNIKLKINTPSAKEALDELTDAKQAWQVMSHASSRRKIVR